MNKYNPMKSILNITEKNNPDMSFANQSFDNQTFEQWQSKVYNKLWNLLGMDTFVKAEPNLSIISKEKKDGYLNIRFDFSSEPGNLVPCHLLLPDGVNNPSVVICLQGHSSGMHISLREVKYEDDDKYADGCRAFAIQAAENGYAALVIEQSGFGLRKADNKINGKDCHQQTIANMLLGRTTISARAWDIMKAIDLLETDFPMVDSTKIGIMGNSGGGIATYYTTCIDPRITAAMPSCSVCAYDDSLIPIQHCICNCIPGVLQHFEMGDLAVLIAPRPIVMVAGKDDSIYPIDASKKAFDTIQAIYDKAGASDKCKLLVGNEGHKFYPELGWPVFNEISGLK